MTGTLSAGLLSNTAPATTPFTATLSGVNQTKLTAVGSWSVTDPTGGNVGCSVTVAASAPAVTVADGPDAGTERDVAYRRLAGGVSGVEVRMQMGASAWRTHSRSALPRSADRRMAALALAG